MRTSWRNFGKIRLVALALVILATGLIMGKWWWQIGGIMLIVIFVQAFYRYRSLE